MRTRLLDHFGALGRPAMMSALAGLLLLLPATGLAGGAPGARSDPELKRSEARSKAADLEREIEELRQLLASKAAELEEARREAGDTAASSPADYAFDQDSQKYDFLTLGVRKNYIRYENGRLLDQLRTTIPPIYEPAFSPFHGYTLPAGTFRLTLGNDRFINNGDFGTEEFYSAFFKDVKVENSHVNVNGFYGLTPSDTLAVIVPFKSTDISGTGEAFRIRPMVMTMEGHSFGVGDVQVNLKHKWLDQGYSSFNLATVVGVQLPTGDNDDRFNDSQTMFVNGMPMPISAAAGGPKVDLFSDDLRIPNSAQPGTGAWGLNLGVMATRQLTWNRLRGAFHGGAMYRAMADTAEGVRPGNELIFGASYVMPPFESDHVSLDLSVFGKNKQSERFPGLIMHPDADPATRMPIMNPDGSMKIFTTPRPPFEHGTVMFFSPSVILIPKSTFRVTVSPMFRIHQPSRGPSPAFRLIFGIQSIF